MLTDVLKGARNVAGDTLAGIVLRVPRLEPALITAGRTMNKIPYVETLYRHTVGTYLKGLQSRGEPFRRFEVCGQEIQFDVTNFTSGDYYFKGMMYEPATTREIIDTLGGGGIFVDVGANTGYFTVLAALRISTGGRVYAFEPNPQIQEALKHHLRINAVGEQVVLIDVALSDKAGEGVDFFISDTLANSGLCSLTPSEFALSHNMLSFENKIQVRTETFDNWAEANLLNTTIDLVKIDVEGAEEKVLCGMERTLSSSPPKKIVCETTWESPAHRLLCRMNYEARPLDVSNELYGNILYTHRPSA